METSIQKAANPSIQENTLFLPPSIPPYGPEADELSLAELWRVLRRRKWIILATIAVCVALAVAYCTLKKPRYTATAEIAIDPSRADGLNMEDLGMGAVTGDAQAKLETEVRVLRSESLALDTISRLQLANNPMFYSGSDGRDIAYPKARAALLTAWNTSLTVKSVPKTNMIELSFKSKSPDLSANALNTLIDSYVERTFKVKFDSAKQASVWLSQQLEDIKVRTQDAEKKLADYQRENGIVTLDDSGDTGMRAKVEELSKSLIAAQSDRIVREARYRVAMASDPEQLAEVVPGGTLVVLRAQQADLNNQYAQLTAKYGAAYPRVRQLKKQLQQVNDSITVEVAKTRDRLKDEFDASKKAETMLLAQMDEQKSEAMKLNEKAIQFQLLRREAQSNRDLYEGLLKKLNEAGVVAGLKSTNTDVVDRAAIPAEPSEPRTLMIIALALGGGMFLGVVGAFVLENLDDSINSSEEAELHTYLPSLASIPSIRASDSTKIAVSGDQKHIADQICFTDPRSHAAEAFRALRTSVLLSRPGAPPKVIVFTSSFPSEGKSTCSLNMATVLAQKNARVLLIDADMRRGHAARRLQVPDGKGLGAVLSGVATLDECLEPVERISKLWVLPAGIAPPFPAELLESPKLAEMLEECKKRFDFVVIDTPPVLAVTDAVIIATAADATVLVVRAGQTGRQGLKRACDLLQRARVRINGLVVNGVNSDSKDHYYYYGYGKRYANYIEEGKSDA